MSYEYKQFYRRKLPHRHSPGATLFVTFRLVGTIPKVILRQWQNDKRILERELARLNRTASEVDKTRLEFHRQWFAKFETVLHKANTGPIWLKNAQVARMVFDSLLYRHDKEFELFAFCIMANHVHVLFRPILDERSLREVTGSYPLKLVSDQPTLGMIMQSLKGFTARKANLILKRSGSFWDPESYDHEVRNNEEFFRIKRYILNNPVKAGLVRDWRDWPWSYDSSDDRVAYSKGCES